MTSLPDPFPIRPRGELDLQLRPPGSRSLTNRALLAAALASGQSRLSGLMTSEDTRAMRAGLCALGVVVEEDAEGASCWRVRGRAGRLRAPSATLDVGASGTTARFLAAAATLADGAVTLDGSPRMRARPIVELARALSELGATALVRGKDGCPPLWLAGGGLQGGRCRVSAARSSQFVSGLLLAAPCAERKVEIELQDGALVSRPFVDMTINVMRAFGAKPEWQGDARLTVPASGYQACDYFVEPDAQAAVYGFCAVAICGGRARVEGLPPGSVQGDLGLLDALEAMGCSVVREAERIVLCAPATGLRGIEVDGNAWPDAVLALAVVALFAEGPTTIRGIAHLRLKESDRLRALESELQRLGARARATADALRIEPGPPRAATIETFEDHRMAMSFALAGLRIPGVKIRDPGCVAKTWPGFFDALESW